MGWVAFFAVLAALAALPIWIERNRDPVGEAQRRSAPGGFARLSQGVTHYRWHGPDGGRVAVFVHGLTTSSYVWQGLVNELAVQGYRCLTYDLYGRGLSDRPGGPQTRSFFLMQLRELLEDQGVNERFLLVGYSMGASIGTVFAAEEPDRLRGLVLLAPAGLTHVPRPFSEFCRRVPYLGDWMMSVFGGMQLRAGVGGGPSSVPDIGARQAGETRTRGYLPAVLSSQRNILNEHLAAEHAAIAEAGLPVLAVWGEDDTVIPLRALGELAQINRDARQVTIPGAGHGVTHTHARQVAEAIVAFGKEH